MRVRILSWAYAVLVSAISLLALLGVLLFAWHVEDATPWVAMGPGDWGVWIGSIGTVATLLMTIRLATSAQRKNDREQRDMAIIAAATLETAVSTFIERGWISVLLPHPGSLAAPDNPKAALEDCLYPLRSADLWTREDLVPLVYLPGHIAARLASLSTRIRAALNELTAASEKTKLSDYDIHTAIDLLNDKLPTYLTELEKIKEELANFLASQRFASN